MVRRSGKNKIKLILVLILLVGLFILLYPFVSRYWNSLVQSRAIFSYDEVISLDESIDYDKLFQEAYDYNLELAKLEYPLVQYKRLSNTSNFINIKNNGMIGYITIDKIGLKVPIYHGTSSSVLNVAVGHLKGSSLPVGGENTHSVLSAHSGLPSNELFTNLRLVEIGDIFVINVMNEKLTYQVDKIMVVDPNDVSNLEIIDGYDYVTLITCTPYGINTHRLLVRGSRITNLIEKELVLTSDAYKIDRLVVTFIISILIFLIFIIYIVIKPVKKKNYEEEGL